MTDPASPVEDIKDGTYGNLILLVGKCGVGSAGTLSYLRDCLRASMAWFGMKEKLAMVRFFGLSSS